MNRKINYSPTPMSLQFSQTPLNQNVLQSNNIIGLNTRQSHMGIYNSPMQPSPINYHNRTINQQKQQMVQNAQQILNFGGRNYKPPIPEQEYQVDFNGQRYKDKSRSSMDQHQTSSLTPKQINLLDKIENIKKKGYSDDGQQKLPPLASLQFPNLHSYMDPPQTDGNRLNPSVINPQQNQKNNMVNTFNGYRKESEINIRSPYTFNSPYNKPAYESFSTKVNRLPKLDNTPTAMNGNPSYIINGNTPNSYENNSNIMNANNPNIMIGNNSNVLNVNGGIKSNYISQTPQAHINNGYNSQFNQVNTNLHNNGVKSYQNTLSPVKKYGNVSQVRYTPEKQNYNQNNSFNHSPSQFKEDTNITSDQMFRYVMKTKAGCTINKVTKTNQDSAIVNPKVLSDINIYQFAVGDGHGLNGHLVSQLIKRNLPKNFQKFLKADDYSADNIKNAITRGFYTTNQEIFSADFDSNLSGSTLISVFIHENKIYCGNVGDSRAVIGKQQPNTAGFKAHPLSTDHKPCLERERLRIIKSGGRVDCQRDYSGQPLGPLRVWLKSMDIPGLAMTRSMGDKVGVQAGVIAEPEFEEMEITEEDKFMVVASDGVWEYLSDQDVIKIVGQFYDRGLIEQAAEKLITESTNAWKRESLVRDDITCIVVFFNHQKKI